MRALLFATAAVLALAACDNRTQTAEVDVEAAEAEQEVIEATEDGPPADAPVDVAEVEPAAPTMPGSPDAAETRPPNTDLIEHIEPAFAEQTRAPTPAESHAWRVEEVASGLTRLWGIEFLPDGRALVTERPGAMRIVTLDGQAGEPIAGVPEVVAQGQGGLFDVVLAPDFEESRVLYIAYAEPREEGASGNAVARARLADDGSALEDLEVIFQSDAPWASPGHYGGRLLFDAEGEHLFITLGERMLAEARVTAQTPEDNIGTIVRLNPDGSIPEDNPYADGQGGKPEVWSYGHRNVQGADIDPVTGRLWTTEHGPRGGDELNQPEPGKNHGWPIVCYCIDYSGAQMADFEQVREGIEQPVYYWDPVIAPGGSAFYTGDLFPNWTNDLFVAGQGSQRLSRLVFNEDRTRIVGEEWLPIGERTREAKTGPDGAIYVITDEDNARLLRIVPG